MPKIIQLSEHVANMIAAGEVVESPLSVVKELVENAIDAGSTNIRINLMESGIQKIEIVDNGCGMEEEDALMAFNRHATSKIRTAYDLASIDTLGFRGEALPSIASVSLLELYTKTEGSDVGIKVTYKAGKLVSKESAPCNLGTRIVVSNLFYNTPARLKYLKSPNVILASICELIDKLALANRTIRFTLTNNNQTLLTTDGIDNITNLFAMIYGTNVAKAISTNEGFFDGMDMKVTFTNPTITRSRKNDITLVVNGRFVKSNIVTNAVCDAYKNYVPPLRYPICLVDLHIDPLLIDVNVHPQKMEIKFSMENEVYKLTKRVLEEGLKKLTIIPTMETETVKPKVEPINFDSYLNIEEEQKKPILKEVDSLPKASSTFMRSEPGNILEDKSILPKEEKNPVKEENKETAETTPEPKETPRFPYLEYIGQFSGTYLLFQNEEGLYLVDQHAAQERINYEYYFEKLGNPSKESTPLLIPFNIEFKREEAILLKEHQSELEVIGLILEPSGLQSFFVREIPSWIKADNPEIMIEKILYFLLERNSFDIAKLRDSMAKQMACKASIKANHFVSKEGAYALLHDLEKCKNPFNCPHGRPVFVKITNYEIEKLFKRVM